MAGPLKRIDNWLHLLGPGIAVAATGVGAGDLISGTAAGAQFGTTLLWAAAFSALLKYALNEGVARWQLATGTTILEGWCAHLGRPFQYYFLVYLIGWSFMVGGGLISACGIAGHTMFPQLSVSAWAILHSLAGAALVLWGRYTFFEKAMKVLIAIMFFSFVASAWVLRPEWSVLLQGLLVPQVPTGSARSILSVIGGVGGSLTILCYGYWIRESGRNGPEWMRPTRIDLGVAYGLTGFFGVAVILISAQMHPEMAKGSQIVMGLAQRLEEAMGPAGRWAMYLGFWGAVASSLLGVWQGIPYLFADTVGLFKGLGPQERAAMTQPTSKHYRAFLAFLTFAPLSLLLFEKPVGIVVAYTIVGALFMPFLAITLLYMNARRAWVGDWRNGWLSTVLLVAALLVFAYLSFNGVVEGAS